MAIGGFGKATLSSRNLSYRKRLHKQLAARRMLLEGLEGRQLMAVGPQLLGIQPNEGSLLENGQVRHISPNELVFRFDDRAGLDPTTLDGIRIIRAGADGAFERASVATDLGSGGTALVEFYAQEPGQVGNGIQIQFSRVSRNDSRLPVVRVTGRLIEVEVNSNPALETRIDDLLQAFDPTKTTPATSLVYGLRLRGSTTTPIGRTVDTSAPYVLGGANAAKTSTDFGAGANLQVRLSARNSGASGVGLQVKVTSRDFGGAGSPIVTVSGQVITVELNSNSRFGSSVGDFISAINGDSASAALVEATLVSGSTSTRIGTLPTTYSPLTLGGVSDIEIVPAYVGLGDTSREVIMRFGEALPDDKYRIEILGRGTSALLNLNGQAFNDGVDKAVAFELDLGAKIESIVPQPVERVNGVLTQARNRIDLYFNNDDLIDPGTLRSVNGLTIDALRQQRSPLFFLNTDVIINQAGATVTLDAINPQFYQLYHLAGTLTNTDDTRILPTSVRYFPDADRVVLTFSRNLDELVDPSTNAALQRGELRLRVGSNEPKPLPPTVYTPALDAGDTFANPENLNAVWTPGVSGSQSVLLNAEIVNTSAFALDFPGGSNEIGNRQNRMQDHFRRNFDGTLVSADSVDGTSTVFYNFQSQLGRSSSGATLLNAITEQQKQRVREVFSLYERYLGVRFVETANLGLTVAVGDTRAVAPYPETKNDTSPGVITLNSVGAEYLESGILANGQPATVLDLQDFGNSVDSQFGGAFTRAAMQGVGNLLGLGNTDELEGFTTQKFTAVQAPGVGSELVFPGDSDIVHGQYLYRPDSKDIDLYQFRLPTSGMVSIEAFAERMSQASMLDSQLRLYQQQANGSWTEIAANDDYYSSDSFVELNLSAGNYIVGVSASGNNQYDPNIADSGLGGRSQGKYQLRMDFHPPAAATLRDATGTSIDGDADGVPAGVHDFWFRPSGPTNTKFVDKSVATSGNGSLAAPYKFIKDAIAASQSGDVIRIVGNGGTDGKLNTASDNVAYEVGFDLLGRALPDGSTLDVPKNVSLFIDAGAILKLRRARVSVGSTSNSVDRSGGSLMVLGTPVLVDSTGAVLKDATGVVSSGNVIFTSVSDASTGAGSSSTVVGTTPAAGDWGGIDFRNRIDGQDANRKNYEKLGQFLNYVSHADLRYGGGQVVIDGVSQVVTPVQMVDSRPTVLFSKISKSADAAMSATPNSFLETNFHTPDEQRAGVFSADYDRVGPNLHGNTVTGNTVNGLLVRARTTGGTVDSLTVPGRFDDTDIVHFIPENLQIVGTVGGFTSTIDAPPTTIVTLSTQAGGTLPAGTYNYKLTYVDASGNESPASEATVSRTVVANSSIVLSNLPPVASSSGFVSRRLYRSDATGGGVYQLVMNLNASSTTIVDTGATIGSPLNPGAPNVSSVALTPLFFAGTLTAGVYNYRMTFVDAAGNESNASLPSNSVSTFFGPIAINLSNLPVAPSGFVARRLYRSDSTGGGTYTLVSGLDASSTTFFDSGASIGSPLTAVPAGLRARLDARLAVDPGTVVKLQGSRIDVQFGAQLIAEGTEDRPIVFTSSSDSRYGAGGTFATTSGGTADRGNWGGIYVGPTSSASIDHAVISYGGGTTRVEGGFADFNAVESQQGDLRLTRSRLENNADGTGTSTDPSRSGRGTNADATVFIRGSQPILVDNVIVNNAGAAFSANVSALNSQIVTDWGRSTGAIDRASERLDNQGPLLANNRMDKNGLNGFVIRGGILTTEGVWDDTDIVHIVQESIQIPDFHTYGGLRLQSSAAQSLVVKLLSQQGNLAGFTASGTEVDNANRIGGSVQLIGTPGNPVIMTSLNDCTVGVGFTPTGGAQYDTTSSGACDARLDTAPYADIIVVMDDSASMGFAQTFSGQLMQDIDAALIASGIGTPAKGGNRFGLVAYGGFATNPQTVAVGPNGAQFGTAAEYNTAVQTLQASGAIEDGYLAIDYALTNYTFRADAEKFVLLVTNEDRDIVDPTKTYASTLAKLQAADVTLDSIVSANFVDAARQRALAVDSIANAYLADGTGSFIVTPGGSVTSFDTTKVDYVDLTWETGGISGDIFQIQFGGATTTSFSSVMVSSVVAQAGGNLILPKPGDWSSVAMNENSNDRNVAIHTEIESPQAKSPGSNGSTSSSEFLGDLAPDLKSGDENLRLGYQIQGVISEPGDVDVYSFRGKAGTEVWLDIDRTLNSLDTVVELVDADGRTLALSDNSQTEEADPSQLFASTDMPSQSVHSLRKSTPELYLQNANGTPKDLYSTNPRDAGMRVVLPGEPGSEVLYQVRVRSSNRSSGDPLSKLLDPAQLNGGLTKGAYQLQVRLQEKDEVPGSSVTYADIRYATNGVEIHGLPKHSPLLGENGETTANNDSFNSAQALGNLLQTDRQAISVAGSLDSFTDVDWYSVDIDFTAIRPTALREYFATVFDVDYADGIGRPDVSIYIFNANGQLVLGGLSSNVVDDQAPGLSGADSQDLSRGSSGSLDPYIGSVELPAGRYFLAVTNSDNVPRVLQSFTSNTVSGATAQIRLQPINGVQLIAEDHIESQGGSTAVTPQTPVLFPTGNSNVTFDLSDVNLYVSQDVGLDITNLYMVNPLTGAVSNTVGRAGFALGDIAFRFNGGLRAFDKSPENRNANNDQDTEIDYVSIDPGTGVGTDIGDSGLQTFHIDGTNATDSNDGMYPEAITFASIGGQERGFFVASRPNFLFPRANVGSARPGPAYMANVLYEFDENSGAAISTPAQNKTGIAQAFGAGTAVQERGFIDTGTIGAIGNILIGKDVTTVSATGATTRQIRDGQFFVLLDSANFAATFEFDSGPEVQVNYDPANGFGIVDGLQFSLDGTIYEFDTPQGTAGVSAGAVAIKVSETATYKQFIDAIARSVINGVTVSAEGNRLNFSGALVGDFTAMQNRGIFFDLGSSGNLNPGSIKVPFLAGDSGEALAARIAIAINSSGIPGLSATVTGVEVAISGGTISSAGPLIAAGAAPGGTITGIAVLNGTMFAVSDQGGLYQVNSPTSPAFGNVGTYITSSYELLGINFTGLTAGPANLQNGAFANMLFGIDAQGTMYAFDTNGHLQSVFANGASSVSTGLFNATGLAFSTLDYNLWHVTNQRSGETGHGQPATPDGSRVNITGGSSLQFGFESPAANGVNYTTVTDPGIRNSYDFPGGAAGAIESQAFTLEGLAAGDKPTLYFNYRFDTEQAGAALPLAQSQTDYMRDALRVYVSGEDGQWVLVATNNGTRGPNSVDDEFDPFVSGNTEVQELFDNDGQWRQARVPLDIFAGQRDVRLRVEFSSAGGFGFGLQGGKGAQLRMLAGDRLVDGQTLTVHGRQFEIEMGPSLSLPSGNAISNGNSVTIEGVTYVFTDGSGAPVVAPNVAVPFNKFQTAEEVANTLFNLVSSTPRPQNVINLTATEQNDTFATAIVADTTGDSALITVAGEIGDNPATADPTADVDLVRVDLARGATVLASVNALSIGSSLDSLLRVFDSEGNELAVNDNVFGTTDSRINFTAPEDGTYYFGVSGSGNGGYNPAVFGTATASNSGVYRLVLDISRQLTASLSLNRLQLEGAAHVSVPVGSPIVLQGSLGTTTGATPIYINVGMTAGDVGLAVQQALRDTFAAGSTSVYPLRGDTLDLTGLVVYDSFDFVTGLPAPSVNELSPGPFGATTNFIGDTFGAFNASSTFNGGRTNANPGALRAQNNDFEGVYLDDFIIGIAGRGEMVINAPANDTTFVQDPQLTRTTPPLVNPEVLVGAYQVEIRGGTEYAVPLLQGLPQTLQLISATGPQEREADGVSIRFNGASSFAAGTTFTISDGTRTLTFELDDIDDGVGTQPGNVPVPFSNFAFDPVTNSRRSESAETIAARVRDLINSSQVQSVLDVTAVLLNSDSTQATTGTLVLIGQPSVAIPASVGQTIISKGNASPNREREQGQVVVKSTKVSNSSGFGVLIDSGGRDANGAPNVGVPRNLLTLNTDRLMTGAVVMNNLLVGNRGGGISISGEATAGTIAAPVPYARVINNTIVGTVGIGGVTSGGGSQTGISVSNNASPTLMNNAITNHDIGLSIDATSTTTVVGGTLFHRNTADTAGSATVGQFPLTVSSTLEVFKDVENGNFYPAANSALIDSSIDSLQDRPSIVATKAPLGMSASTLVSPRYDLNGLLRVDDPSVSAPSGLGESVFKDRGALDRADFVGPSIFSLTPVDNDVAGQDRNPATSVVELTNVTLPYFDFQLYDGLEPSDPNRGSNIDDRTVTSSSVLVYRDNVPLVEGIDYRFGYDKTTNVIRLTPLAGVWQSSSVYSIRFINTNEYGIPTLKGRDYADATTIDIVDSTGKTTSFELDTGFRISVPSANGTTADVSDGGFFTVDDGVRRLAFEFDTDGNFTAGRIQVPISGTASPTEVARTIQAAIKAAQMALTVTEIAPGQLQIDGANVSQFLVGSSALTVAGQPGVRTAFGLQIPLVAGRPVDFVDGETFTIRRSGAPVTFELDTNNSVTFGRIAVRFTAGASAAVIGNALVTAIRGANLGLNPTYAGNGLVLLGGDASTVLGLSTTQLLQSGIAGQAAAIRIGISGDSASDGVVVAKQIAAAINSAGLTGVSATPFGDRVVVEGATSVSGGQAEVITRITDQAGNALKPNQTNGQSTITIFLGEGLDFGDAPDPAYASKKENDGARHTVVAGFNLGATVSPDADAKLIDADEGDDGIVFTSSIVAAFQSGVQVSVTRPSSTAAFLSGWIDFNRDGVFSATERIANQLQLTQATTTLSFLVPSSAIAGSTYARFRLSSDKTSITSPTGVSPDGEVEDYAVTIVSNPYTNSSNRMDVSGDTFVSPIDVLQVINYLNNPATPKILTLPRPTTGPSYVDVNGDGFVTSVDALLVINYLNNLPPRGSSEGEGEGEASPLSNPLPSSPAGSTQWGSLSTVIASDWHNGLEQLAAPPVASGELEESEPTNAVDSFFANDIDEDLLVLQASGQSSTSFQANDTLFAQGVSSVETAIVDDLFNSRVPAGIRQRLASWYRK